MAGGMLDMALAGDPAGTQIVFAEALESTSYSGGFPLGSLHGC